MLARFNQDDALIPASESLFLLLFLLHLTMVKLWIGFCFVLIVATCDLICSTLNYHKPVPWSIGVCVFMTAVGGMWLMCKQGRVLNVIWKAGKVQSDLGFTVPQCLYLHVIIWADQWWRCTFKHLEITKEDKPDSLVGALAELIWIVPMMLWEEVECV